MTLKSTPRRGSARQTCAQCGSEFFLRQNEVGIRRFCSRVCTAVSLTTRVARTCLQCSSPFSVQPHALKNGYGKFCSRSCSARHNGIERWKDTEARFWSQVDKTSTCWIWTGTKLPSGYGFIQFFDHEAGRGRKLYAHQFAWKLATSHIPDGKSTLHTCDTPSCVRNDEQGVYEVEGRLLPRWGHLFSGTPQDNSRDMVRKRRHREHTKPESTVRGERVGTAKMTAEKVRLIRELAAQGMNSVAIAKRVGLSQTQTLQIIRRKSWTHI